MIEKPNLDITELFSTMAYIADCEAEGVDCTALREYIKPITNGRVNLDYGTGTKE